MTPTRDEQVRAVYRAALERPVAERSSFIATLAGSDDDLRRSVERLLSQQGTTDARSIEPAPTQTLGGELPAGTVIAHYRIEGVLGRGGMGVVYRTTDLKLRRAVAIKFLSVAVTDAQAKRRFQQEAETASALNHPHIVTVHDVGEHDGHQYIVSELIDGGTLDDWSIATRRRTWRQSVELLTGVADGIAAAHAADVLHRDVKPSNILVGSNGYAKIADFGLAKLVDPQAGDPQNLVAKRSQHTQAGVVIGTVAYMSPEQASGLPLDARSDVFSFGIVLYEVLAGRVPFEAANDLETLKRIVHAVPPPLPDDIPDVLRMAVEKALEKDPADRYQTMRDFVADLRRVTRKSASSATPALSDAQVVAALVKRHRRGLVAAVAAIVLAVAGGAYLSRLASTDSSSPRDYELTQLTRTGNAISPAISPDGQDVVYVQQEPGGLSGSLWLRRVASPSSVQIVGAEPGVIIRAPTITPDGEFVDFLRAPNERTPPGLWRVPLLGGTPQLIAEDVWGPVGWSPSASQMAFVRVDLSTTATQLVVADRDGRNQRVLATRNVPSTFVNVALTGNPVVRPVWSPNGRVIAVPGQANQGANLAFIDPIAGHETSRDLPDDSPIFEGLVWLGPSALALNTGSIGQPVQIHRLSYPDGALARLTKDLSSHVGLDVNSTRDTLVTARRETRSALWVGDAAGTNGKEIVPPSWYPGNSPTVSWTPERLLYSAASNGRFAITAFALDGGASQEVLANAYFGAGTSDGATIIFAKDFDGLWKTDASGRSPVHLVTGWARWPTVSHDGRHVVFVSQRSGIQSPWSVSIDGGEPTEIVKAPAFAGSLDISPDGRWLLFSSANDKNQRLFVVCELPTCSNRRDLDAPLNYVRSVTRWTPDGRSIAYVDRTGSNLWSVPLEGGPPRQITSFPSAGNSVIVSYAWSRDGQRLAIVRLENQDDIVLIRGL